MDLDIDKEPQMFVDGINGYVKIILGDGPITAAFA